MARRPDPQPRNEAQAKDLDVQIDQERNNIRTDKIDLSYGELASMYEKRELQVSPEYQRLFRWDQNQKASFIESLLLGFPVPAIFVAERGDDGVWELVDGLQRLSTVFEYMGVLLDAEGTPIPASRLSFSATDATKLPLLDGFAFEEMSLRSRLTLKRTYCRVEVIKVGSAATMKYDVFERLNTGGSRLEPQEVRNAIFRATDPGFMTFCDELALFPPFADSLNLSEYQQQSMYDRGLVLRFITLKNNMENFDHDVEPFITAYIKRIIAGEVEFNQEAERKVFETTFARIREALEDDAWRHQRDGRAKGAFSVYVFDALSIGVAKNLDVVAGLSKDDLARRCVAVKEAQDFRDNVGSGGNTQTRMAARLNAGIRIIRDGA